MPPVASLQNDSLAKHVRHHEQSHQKPDNKNLRQHNQTHHHHHHRSPKSKHAEISHIRDPDHHKTYLHPQAHQAEHDHHKDLVQESSSLCLTECVQRLPRIGLLSEQKTKSPTNRETSSSEKFGEGATGGRKKDHEQDKRLYWVGNDFFGNYHRRKIASKYPIPGMMIKSWADRGRRRVAKHALEADVSQGRLQLHNIAIRHRFNGAIANQDLTTSARERDRLMSAIAGCSEQIATLYNQDPQTQAKLHVPPASDAYTVRFLKVDHSYIDPQTFRHGVLPTRQRKMLQDLQDFQTAPVAHEGDVVTDKVIIGDPPFEYATAQTTHARLVTQYGAKYRVENMRHQREARVERTMNKMAKREQARRRRELAQKQKYWDMYRNQTPQEHGD